MFYKDKPFALGSPSRIRTCLCHMILAMRVRSNKKETKKKNKNENTVM